MQIKVSCRHGHISEESQNHIKAKAEKLTHLFDRLTMIEVTVDMSDVERLQAKLNRLENVGATLKTPFVQSASDIQTWMKEYPPLSEANRPRPGHTYYLRGYGSTRFIVDREYQVIAAEPVINEDHFVRLKAGMSEEDVERVLAEERVSDYDFENFKLRMGIKLEKKTYGQKVEERQKAELDKALEKEKMEASRTKQ